MLTVEPEPVAEEPAPVAKELKRVWGKYAPDSNGWIVMGAGNLDRGMAMDNQYIYVSKSTAYAPVIKAFDFAGGRLGYFVADPAFIEAVGT